MGPFRTYWRAYGGFSALLCSDYFFSSVAITFGAIPLWMVPNDDGEFAWVDLSFQILPTLMSFSLAALAVLLALSNQVVMRLMRNKGAQSSYLMKVSSALLHFILVDFVALFAAVGLLAYPCWAVSGIAFLFFAYALLCGIAAALSIFSVAKIVNYAGILDQDDDPSS